MTEQEAACIVAIFEFQCKINAYLMPPCTENEPGMKKALQKLKAVFDKLEKTA